MALVLIGPVATGKTTLAKLLAAATGKPHVSLDDTRWIHYPEQGYRPEKARAFIEKQDFLGLAHYWHTFDLHNIRRTLEANPEGVLDFGGGHTLFFEGEEATALKALLEPHAVILVLPTKDREQSRKILRSRIHAQGEHPEEIYRLNDLMLDSTLNVELSNFVLYTEGESPEQSVQRILEFLRQDTSQL
ncbi:hypothetical protein [Deinococcus cellulosilyticus]|uniref:Shikimate kinase n=1 Tax=Deinococcus cellulosilyticus (strain DSM 18568 / NBRC 106333 / KACC 11606 / 5516J-15) TaxID=1223518 RepID=A0A511N7V3_DEIC1|nr:hypothetical protein [Deinococcus cellulosilyticus]GEM48910.1 hypothetical protein DC3_45450 [Deinococcus cellulosilyticus NBRC 106333 = KACC 11606]